MGCINSKKESSDLHPNVFRVVNIDEHGVDQWLGQLEIREIDIKLSREEEVTVWPLHSLRRYGFEGEMFSFESGRRCDTGEGIYAFRCRRAAQLFIALQQKIRQRNLNHEAAPYPVSRLTPSPQGRQTLQASVVHRSSVDNGQPLSDISGSVNNNLATIVPNEGHINQAPRSPSSVDILEVMPLYPRNQSNQATNIYQLNDFKREHNNNTQLEAATDSKHVYSNDLSRDLAMLRNTLRQEAALNTIRYIEDENRFLEGRYVNENTITSTQTKSPLSPTLSSSSEHYAQLTLEQQESSRLYMNIRGTDNLSEFNRNELLPTTPHTPNQPKQVEYCNLQLGVVPEMNSYANLALGEPRESMKKLKQTLSFSAPSEHNQKFSESDTFTSLSPVEDLEVNYAILDIELKDITKTHRELTSPEGQSYSSSKNDSVTSGSSQARARLVSQCSVEKPLAANISTAPANIGYTTIDFDKTVALTSVAAGTDVDGICDGPRKTRHNSCNMGCGSPGCGDKNKTFS